MVFYRVPWQAFEQQIAKTLGGVAVTILILLAVGMLAGSWMVSGIVPTLIYYGVQLLSPQLFLLCACVICALVSLLSGSSWTTIATIGVALLGISHALGINEAVAAGAIISGAYFGDKMSPLSDTTILASSTTGVDLFTHIRYMMFTTMPAFTITLIIFAAMGFGLANDCEVHVHQYTEGLSATYNISLWTLIVPVLTAILIARRVPSLIVLFLSAMMAGINLCVHHQINTGTAQRFLCNTGINLGVDMHTTLHPLIRLLLGKIGGLPFTSSTAFLTKSVSST